MATVCFSTVLTSSISFAQFCAAHDDLMTTLFVHSDENDPLSHILHTHTHHHANSENTHSHDHDHILPFSILFVVAVVFEIWAVMPVLINRIQLGIVVIHKKLNLFLIFRPPKFGFLY